VQCERIVGNPEVANSGRELFGASNPPLRLVAWPEDISQIRGGPADRTSVRWKSGSRQVAESLRRKEPALSAVEGAAIALSGTIAPKPPKQ